MAAISASNHTAAAVAKVQEVHLPTWPTSLEEIDLWLEHLEGLRAARISGGEAEKAAAEAEEALAATKAMRVARRKAERAAMDAARAHITAAKLKQAEALSEIQRLSTSFPGVVAPVVAEAAEVGAETAAEPRALAEECGPVVGGAKKRMSPEQKAKLCALRAAKKEARAAVVEVKPVAEVEPDAAELELIPFKGGGINYLRAGERRSGSSEPIWECGGDLWYALADGSRGAYAGLLKADGIIDSSPDVIANEPEIE
jgi:hypothetical protein